MGKYNATAYDRKQAKELLAQGYKYLARDKEGILTAYDKKPYKHRMFAWRPPSAWASPEGRVTDIDSFGFKFIKWEDDEPTLIADIVHGGKKI